MQASPERGQGHLIIYSCLENVLNHETQQGEKEKMSAIIKRFKLARDYRLLTALTQPQYKLFKMLIDAFTAYKKSFLQAIAQEKYRSIDNLDVDVCTFLADVQASIRVNRLSPTFNQMVGQYTVQFIKSKRKYGWNSQFLMYWTALAKVKLNILQKTRAEGTAQKTCSRVSPAQIPRRFIQQKSKTKVNLPDQCSDQSKLIQRANQKPKQIKSLINRLEVMEKYLEERIDLVFNKNRHKNVTQLITLRLDHFMKITIQKLIDIAALKNGGKKDQLSYFRVQNQRISNHFPFNVASSKIFTISYKNKLQIYKQLREKQWNKQDELRAALESKLYQTEQKFSNVALSYLVSPRYSTPQQINILQQQQKCDNIHQDSLQVRTKHAICYLESHRYLRNSQLLFDSYHY